MKVPPSLIKLVRRMDEAIQREQDFEALVRIEDGQVTSMGFKAAQPERKVLDEKPEKE